jgi:N-methylhydantoinase B/oxoprolinase/acetone carboxylase alpha subunit
MGAVLEQTAHSVNIKERLDFSCAIFDPRGNLLANAPHIPVHLGSMDAGVQNLLEEHRDDLTKGTCFASNAPYKGGTHLPDVTVVTPVLNKSGSKLVFLVAARAHHADIGGITPGSMPPQSQHIDEEGIVLDNVAIVREGELLETALREILSSGPWPARNPDQNIADFKAQLAANERGRHLLCEMSAERGDTQVSRYCEHLLNNAEESVRAVISRLSNGTFRYPFDNGQHIEVAVKVDMQTHSAVIDFTGTSTAAANNLNAPGAVTQAAVMYVFRALVNSDIPLNAGCRRPLQLVLPAGSMLNPEYPAAVVGGNVETSQCIVDALFGALGVLAASQGTMNNLSFGNAELQYYETICGGAGAGDDYPGTSAVQTHMTNSRMTDPEVLESRFPILVREFSIRKNSGGAGRQPGGDGVIRKLEFRESMHAAILSNHRVVAPFGLEGGDPGKTGRNQIIRAAGTIENYDGILTSDMQPGDILVIATPGGGGYGPPESK